ncbi:hypothetical protein EYF80_060128 [Liparis tanakae]|uniref:Uncharacterized protein n=1 Tax=Liparis tanakae TaxID=230148 RepID=A0A4Z2ELJ7_9TELE|nr:hypothetical protein EYF80_060128 [Liparis tanakae]
MPRGHRGRLISRGRKRGGGQSGERNASSRREAESFHPGLFNTVHGESEPQTKVGYSTPTTPTLNMRLTGMSCFLTGSSGEGVCVGEVCVRMKCVWASSVCEDEVCVRMKCVCGLQVCVRMKCVCG